MAVLVDGGACRYAWLGSGPAGRPEHVAFEIGSVAKPLTGMLLADLAERGPVAWDTTLADLLPGRRFRDRGLASSTVVELATHRSGLPRLPRRGPLGRLRGVATAVRGGNPYAGIDEERLIATALRAELTHRRGDFAYSNFGMALLGSALGRHLGRDYATLLTEGLLEPLGMKDTRVARSVGELPVDRAEPHFWDGTPVSPWISPAYAPAGVGVWSTAHDLALLMTAIVRGTAPGGAATVPRAAAARGNRVGLGWMIEEGPGRRLLWHDGGTGGSACYLALDQEAGRGVAVLSDTVHPVDGLGRALLEDGGP